MEKLKKQKKTIAIGKIKEMNQLWWEKGVGFAIPVEMF